MVAGPLACDSLALCGPVLQQYFVSPPVKIIRKVISLFYGIAQESALCQIGWSPDCASHFPAAAPYSNFLLGAAAAASSPPSSALSPPPTSKLSRFLGWFMVFSQEVVFFATAAQDLTPTCIVKMCAFSLLSHLLACFACAQFWTPLCDNHMSQYLPSLPKLQDLHRVSCNCCKKVPREGGKYLVNAANLILRCLIWEELLNWFFFGNPDHYYDSHSGHHQGVCSMKDVVLVHTVNLLKANLILFALKILNLQLFLNHLCHLTWYSWELCEKCTVCKWFSGHPVPPLAWPEAGVLLYSAAIAPPDGTWWPKLELKTRKVGICSNNSRVSNRGIIC